MKALCTVLFVLTLGGMSSAQSTAPQDLTEQLATANARAEKFEALALLKDLQISQANFDNLYQQFLTNEVVKQVQAKIAEQQKAMLAFEAKALEARGLKREDFYLDFSTGEIKPVPKPAEKTK